MRYFVFYDPKTYFEFISIFSIEDTENVIYIYILVKIWLLLLILIFYKIVMKCVRFNFSCEFFSYFTQHHHIHIFLERFFPDFFFFFGLIPQILSSSFQWTSVISDPDSSSIIFEFIRKEILWCVTVDIIRGFYFEIPFLHSNSFCF